MESMLAGKPRSVAIGALRALVIPLREHWGNREKFIEAGLDVLAREGGGALYDEKESPAHLAHIFSQVLYFRALHFRPIENNAQLEHLFKELDQEAAKRQATLEQGMLWLASRLQQQAITYLQSPQAERHKTRVLEVVEERRNQLDKALGDASKMTLERVERVLTAFIGQVLADMAEAFERVALAGHFLEMARAAGRKPPDAGIGEDVDAGNLTLQVMLSVLVEPVRSGELNDARGRYARMNDQEKERRYNTFRRALLKIIGEVASFAPMGFDPFCQAIEARMFPYPEPVEFIRSYAQAVYKNASQSTLFTDARTPQSVQQRYDSLVKTKQGNPVVLEIARAFAMRTFQHSDAESKKNFMLEIDFRKEFGWPTTMDDLLQQAKPRA